jgi:hypothetical protein
MTSFMQRMLRLEATREAELAEEIAQHIEDRCRELRCGGASEEDAYQNTISELDDMCPLHAELEGSHLMAKHDAVPAGDVRRGNLIEDFWRDLRYALRTVAETLLEIITSDTPRLCYLIGQQARSVARLRRFLPAGMFEQGVRRTVALDQTR